jgi:hypothetical protein
LKLATAGTPVVIQERGRSAYVLLKFEKDASPPIFGCPATDAARMHAMRDDPFDRLIVAAAMAAGACLATADTKISAFARAAGPALLEL